MFYETKFINETNGKVRLFSDIHGSDLFFVAPGAEEVRQSPNAKNMWSPFSEIRFVVKYPEHIVITKTKKRKGFKNPWDDTDWVVTFLNTGGLDWELWDNPGGASFYLPKGIEVQGEVSPMSYMAKFSKIEIGEPFVTRKQLLLTPGLIGIHTRPNIIYTKRNRDELLKLIEKREWIRQNVTESDPDLQINV